MCSGTVAEIIQSVVNGADGCIFSFGHVKLGKLFCSIFFIAITCNYIALLFTNDLQVG